MTLADLHEGEKAVITKVVGRGAFRKRILEMGFIPGKMIRVVKKAPMKDPVEYNVMGYNVSLRNSEALLIEVITEEEALHLLARDTTPEGTIDEVLLNRTAHEHGKNIHVVLVGNPNSGKTTIFNFASGSHERVGNYSGVTVEAKKTRIRIGGYTIHLIDLPGTYSLSAYSPEELFVRNYILNQHPDVVINVIDASNLERNLYLTTQLIDMDIRVVMALNMHDELLKSGSVLKHGSLGKLLGIPVVPTVGSKGKGIDELMETVIGVYENIDTTLRHIHIHYGNVLEASISNIQQKIKRPENLFLTDMVSSRFLALKLLEKDADASSRIKPCPNHHEIISVVRTEIQKVEDDLTSDTETLITDAKYGFVEGALKETLQPGPDVQVRRSEIIDTFFTHKLWGIPVFIAFMWASFYITFAIGEYPKQWIQWGVDKLSFLLEGTMRAGPLKDLFLEGILGGVGGVIVFLPNILLLFLFISLMEDTGYLARAVFIMDKAMHKIGLHGKSFIPMIMGFGCNVPAIMSTRIIESRRDRMVTMLINPFMSCSARLPVYILFISAFFVNYRGSILFLIYFTGIILAVVSALLLNRTMFRKVDVPFVMELPPYRVPTVRSLVRHMWSKGQQYLRKIAGIILVASIIIWALGYFPRSPHLIQEFHRQQEGITQKYTRAILHLDPVHTVQKKTLEKALVSEQKSLQEQFSVAMQENSFIGRMGALIEPVMRPLGFDWKMSVAIITGIAGKEIVVGTMGVLHQAGDGSSDQSYSLVRRLKEYTYNAGPNKGKPVYNPAVAMAFMLFTLIYFPCFAVIVTIRKESGHWKWAVLTMAYTTLVAWLIAMVTFQILNLFY